jgi:dTDP-glucose 4,6-dehydratase
MKKTWLVTGGAGFIGSNFVRLARERDLARIVNLDLLTYAGNLDNLADLEDDPDHVFVRGDIRDGGLVSRLLAEHRPGAIVHFAAESHVDRSIDDAVPFLNTNILGTHALLDAAHRHLQGLAQPERDAFRFLHVSTDEVFGTLGPDDPAFSERTPYAPNSPYAASKAASDHLVRAYRHTYGLPTLVTNCSNNYGPYQFPEKLLPLMICNLGEAKPLPVYGDGRQVRDWLFVTDHCEAIVAVLERGLVGETYNIGGSNERANMEVVEALCAIFDGLNPAGAPHARLIRHVQDRPGHDRRYAIDSSKIRDELGWSPRVDFATGLRLTVDWYRAHRPWVDRVRSGAYQEWLQKNYGHR